jgi:hypothetical protein
VATTAAVALDQGLHVPAVHRAIGGVVEVRVAEAEADAQALRLVEQRLRGGVGHLRSYQWSASLMSSTNQRGKNVVSASSG